MTEDSRNIDFVLPTIDVEVPDNNDQQANADGGQGDNQGNPVDVPDQVVPDGSTPPDDSGGGTDQQQGTDDQPDDNKSVIDIAKEFVINDYGINIEDELDNTPESLNALFKRVYEEARQKSVEEVLSKHEQLKNLYEYLEAGGDIERYSMTMYPDVDFTKIDIDPEDDTVSEDLMDYIISTDLTMQGYSEEQIKEMLDGFSQANIKGKMAKMSRDKLASIQQRERETLVERQKQEYENRLKEYEEYKKSYKLNLSKAKNIGNIPIAEKDKEDFYNFKFSPSKDSEIKEIPYLNEVLYHTLNPESKRYMDKKFASLRDAIEIFTYYYMKDENFINKLAENRARTIKAEKQLPGFSPVDRMKGTDTRSNSFNENEAVPLY